MSHFPPRAGYQGHRNHRKARPMSVADELQKLQQLRDSGAIDDDEFAAAKARVLNPPAGNPGLFASQTGPLTVTGVSSINAVLRNKPAMLLWAVLIAVLTAVGLATAFVGLVVIMPWLAYATWQAYREMPQAGDWPMRD